MIARISPVLLFFAAFFAEGCGLQPIDSGADDETEIPSGPEEPATLLEDPEIALDPADESATTDDPCAKTDRDAHFVLETYCAGCHDQGAASSGVPRFDFVLDREQLTQATWTVGSEERRFLVPGRSTESWLYLRPLLGTMPPISTDLRNMTYPRPTISDLSILREWIDHCVDPNAMQPQQEPPMQTPPDDAQFNFENDAQGWWGASNVEGQGTVTVAVSDQQSFAGAASLEGVIDAAEPSGFMLAIDNPGGLSSGVLSPGARITMHIYLPAGAKVDGLRPFVADSAGAISGEFVHAPELGAWGAYTVDIPADIGAVARLGVYVSTNDAWHGPVYLDSVDW